MKVLLFGTGDFYRAYRHWFHDVDILALLDNDVQKQGKSLDGHMVVAPAVGISMPYEAVFILSMYYREMREQLLALGVPERKIFGIFDIGRFVHVDLAQVAIDKFTVNTYNDRTRVAILSADLGLNGASIAAVYAAEALAEQYNVTVITPVDGPMRQKLLQAGITVWLAPVLQVSTQRDLPWLGEFHLLFCNTFNWYMFLSRRDVQQPVIWWLHDPAIFYEMTDKAIFSRIDLRNLHIIAVGAVARYAAHTFFPQANIQDLLLGIPDACPQGYCHIMSARMRFAVVGNIRVHKGQDLFIKAISELPPELRNKADFFLVGDNHTALAKKLQNLCVNFPEVHILGELSRNAMLDFYQHIDVVVCCSRIETMSIVVAEAMMFVHPCIVSDHVGAAQYLHDGMDSIIYPVEDVSALAKAMQRFIESPQLAVIMGQRARKVYEEVFKLEIFQHNIKQKVAAMLI